MKKKTRIIALLLVCVLIACTSASFVSAAEPQYYNYGTVSVEAANFRARPELDEKKCSWHASEGRSCPNPSGC